MLKSFQQGDIGLESPESLNAAVHLICLEFQNTALWGIVHHVLFGGVYTLQIQVVLPVLLMLYCCRLSLHSWSGRCNPHHVHRCSAQTDMSPLKDSMNNTINAF